MPELAEVEYYRKQWLPAYGQTVTGIYLNAGKRVFRGVDTNALQRDLVGQLFTGSEAHGKQICFRFGPNIWLGVHLGMTGKTTILSRLESPRKHDHLVLRLGDERQLVFSDPRMFGRILYAYAKREPRPHESASVPSRYIILGRCKNETPTSMILPIIYTSTDN